MATATRDLDLGTGVYSVPEATQIIQRSVGRASARQVRYWLREGLTESVEVDGNTLLSFHDLISLEMISRFRRAGISLQAVRAAERWLRSQDATLRRPLAKLVFYTDGINLWTQAGEHLLELVSRSGQYAWERTIRTFASEITFSEGAATLWRPSEWVEINPRVQFGEPVVAGTRVPARTVVANLEAGSPQEVADWYGLTLKQVEGAKAYFGTAA